MSLTNHGREARSFDLTSYAEVVLAPGDADLSHPAFSNLFVETMAVPERDALICVRRPRSGTDRVYLIHVLSGRGRLGEAAEYETDRARFIGRHGGVDRPSALYTTAPLSNTTGPVLDPIVSLRQAVRIPPGGTARMAFTTGFADSEDGARQLIEKYHDRRAVARALALASTHSQIELRHLGLTIEETMRFQRLSGRLMYGDPRLRSADAVRRNTRGQAELWKYGISGDMPILLVHLKDGSELGLLRDLLKAHEYLRRKGLAFDLVVLNDHASSYLQDLQNAVLQMVERSPEQSWVDRPGGVFLRRADLVIPEDRTLLEAAARVVMDGADGNLREQLKRLQIPFGPEPGQIPEFTAKPAMRRESARRPAVLPGQLEMFNGLGGFADEGREYAISVDQDAGTLPPQPWSNVVAHPTFGFAATEGESRVHLVEQQSRQPSHAVEKRSDQRSPGRGGLHSRRGDGAVLVGDATSGRRRPALQRAARPGLFGVRARAERSCLDAAAVRPADRRGQGLPPEAAQRLNRRAALHGDAVRGVGARRKPRRAPSCTSSRAGTPRRGTIFARNAFRQEFAHRVAFLDLHPGQAKTITGDRTEFIGRNGKLAPARRSCGARRCRTAPAPPSIPVARFRSRWSSSRRRLERSSACWVTRWTTRRRATWFASTAIPRWWTTRCSRWSRSGIDCWGRSSSRHRIARWT